MEERQMLQLLDQLNGELAREELKGEICIYGGAAMCLVYHARPSTKDIDAVFAPTQQMREAIRRVGQANSLPPDWINDGVKGFVVKHPQKVFRSFSHLQVYVPSPDYLLAMKALAARVDATDRADVEVLLRELGITKPEDVFRILQAYYPEHEIRPATQFFIEELLQS